MTSILLALRHCLFMLSLLGLGPKAQCCSTCRYSRCLPDNNATYRTSPILRRTISCYSPAKEVIKGKGKSGRKRKSTALEADEQEPKVACVAKDAMNDKGKRGQKRKSAAQEVD